MTENNAPATPATTFDLDDWLVDAHLPMESADVYKAGSIPAEASALQRKIEIERGIEDKERTAQDINKLVELEKEYAAILTRWAASKITVYVTAIPKDKFQRLRDSHNETTEGMDPTASNELFGYQILAEAIVGIAKEGETYADAGGNPLPYGPITLRPNQIRSLEKKIGPPQMQRIMAARQAAQHALPEVDADFLHRNSGPAEEDTQD